MIHLIHKFQLNKNKIVKGLKSLWIIGRREFYEKFKGYIECLKG